MIFNDIMNMILFCWTLSIATSMDYKFEK